MYTAVSSLCFRLLLASLRTTVQFSAVTSRSFQLIRTFIFEAEKYVGRCIARQMMVIEDELGQHNVSNKSISTPT